MVGRVLLLCRGAFGLVYSTVPADRLVEPMFASSKEYYILVWFYGISTIVGYLNAKSSLYIHIKYI